MRFSILLVCLVGLVHSVCTTERIAQCAITYLDLDGDEMISSGEINMFSLYQHCWPLVLTAMGETVIKYCDRNNDGYMTQSDLEAAPFNCLTIPVKAQLCKVCDQCDANPPGQDWYNKTVLS